MRKSFVGWELRSCLIFPVEAPKAFVSVVPYVTKGRALNHL